jgi:uncharacterized protein YqeY
MKDRLKTAMFNHNDIEKNILRVVIGEVNQLQMTSQQGVKIVNDEQIAKILRKLVQSNLEVLSHAAGAGPERLARNQILEAENSILESLLPKQLNQEEIELAIVEGIVDVTLFKSTGQAVGLAMKFFKDRGDFVDGNDVKTVVEKLRVPSSNL